jgi:hypothetical protein
MSAKVTSQARDNSAAGTYKNVPWWTLARENNASLSTESIKPVRSGDVLLASRQVFGRDS